MKAISRLWLSAIIATTFYGGWSLFANALITDDVSILIRSSLVQGLYSGGVTLLFTWLLEHSYNKVGRKQLSFAFVVPLVCMAHHETKHANMVRRTFNHTLDMSARWFNGVCWPSVLFAPLIPLAIQSALVTGVNLINQTPNLLLTIAPSILFSGLYGYMYTLSLYRKREQHSADQPIQESDTLSKQTNV